MADSDPQEAPPNKALRLVLWMRQYSTLLLVVVAAVLGICFVLVISQMTSFNSMGRRFEFLYLIGFPGMVFLRLLQLIVIPLVMISIAYAVGNLDATTSGVLGLWSAVFFGITTVIASALGIALAHFVLTPARIGKMDLGRAADIRPLAYDSQIWQAYLDRASGDLSKVKNQNPNFYTLLDTARNLFTNNIVGSFISIESLKNPVNQSAPFPGQIVRRNDSTNVLGIIFIAIMGGALVAKLGPTSYGKLILELMLGINTMMTVATGWIIWTSPFGVISLILENILRSSKDLPTLGVSLLWYLVTTVTAMAIQLLIVLQIAYFLVTRKNPLKFFGGVLEAFVTAVGTGSSNATLPILINCLVTNNGLDRRVASFVCSIGATVNMNGTAVYESIASIFLAALTLPRALGIGDYVIISVTSSMAAVGAAGVPGAGLLMLFMVLDSVGVNPSSLAFLMPLDWMLGRMRATINVMGNAFGAGVLNHLMKDKLAALDASRKREEDAEKAKLAAKVADARLEQGTTEGSKVAADEPE